MEVLMSWGGRYQGLGELEQLESEGIRQEEAVEGMDRSLHEGSGKPFIKGLAANVQGETSWDLPENSWYRVQSSTLVVEQCCRL